MKTSILFLQAECHYVGQNMYEMGTRCDVCNTIASTMHQYDCVDPDYKRSFVVCNSCYNKVQTSASAFGV